MKTSLLILLFSALADAAPMRAGFARVNITPKSPIYLSGYAARTKPSEGVLQPIWAKGLAIQDTKGVKTVIVTTDLIGLPRSVTDMVSARVLKDLGIERARLLFNASHTHSGPMVGGNLQALFDLTPGDEKAIQDYTKVLTEDLYQVVSAAVSDLAPAVLAIGHGTTDFAINRRVARMSAVSIGVNPKGPVDHDVPVIRVTTPDGKLRGVLFAYACHNTTLGGDLYQVNGDYAGFAQSEFETSHPGATAMFMILCGADQNPNPRGKVEHAMQYGKSLSDAVSKTIDGRMDPITGPVQAAYKVTQLNFKTHDRSMFENDLKDKLRAKVRRAELMLKLYDERRPIRSTPYPVQALRFGKTLTLVALGGEVVIDYNLRIKKEFPGEHIIVAGYSNDVMCYIPSLRILKEGGYEAVDSMIYYGQPGPFDEHIEESVMDGVYSVMKRVGRKPAK
jgi:neutral/alkaline ceramidase-like enzyme